MAFFYVLDDGVYVPTTDLAQSYAALNFKQGNSLGVGTDTLIPTSNPDNPNWIADIKSQDYWGYTEDGNENLYRLSSIGINTNDPQYSLDISGDFNVSLSANIGGNLNVAGITTFVEEVEFQENVTFSNTITDAYASTGEIDYRLASLGPGVGVSWRPPGVETQNTIWVTKDGDDGNSGLLEGDAKATIGAAAAIAQEGDTIVVRAGTYTENNPIGLRNNVSITGQDLRLVNLVPSNLGQDFFHIRRGCLIENLSFISENLNSGAAVAFAPTGVLPNTGYLEPGPADAGSTGRWKSPYIRNCTNFMPGSIGMKINGDDATASTNGADLKSMVCDSFTQYNEAGIGVSITNNGYAQLVSIFTINCDKAIYCDTGGSCDLTNSNSSFGNFGLYAVGLGRTEFTGITTVSTTEETDRVSVQISTQDSQGNYKRPYDGQALFFQIPINGVPLTDPLVLVDSVTIVDPAGYTDGVGFSPSAPPSVSIVDISNSNRPDPLGPEGIIAEFSPTVDEFTGRITSIEIVNSGRNYLPTQASSLRLSINGVVTGNSDFIVNTSPIYYTVFSSTLPDSNGNCIITFNEFIPYLIDSGVNFDLKRISRILTSSHSFEYVGAGTDINTVTPLQGAVPIKENEIVALSGAQIPFTSTDQQGNFDIGEGFQINQPTSTIRGRAFSKAIQAELTPLILALGR